MCRRSNRLRTAPSDVDRADLAEGAISGDSAASEAISDLQELEAGGGPQESDSVPLGQPASPQGPGCGPQTQGFSEQGPGYGPQGQGAGPQGPGRGPQGSGHGPQDQGYGPQGPGHGPQGSDAGPQGQGYGPQGPGHGPQGSGAGPQGQGYGPQGQGHGPQGSGAGPQGQGYGPQGPGHGPQGSGAGPQGQGYGPQGPGHGPQGSGVGPQGQGYGPQGSGAGPQSQGYGPQGPGHGPQGQGAGPQGPGSGPQGQGYGPQGPGMGAQGQPYYGRPYPQKKPSEFGANLVQWFLGIFRKDPTEIFESVSHSKSPVWIIYMAVYAVFGALALACSIGRVATLFGNIGILSGLDHVYHSGSVRLAVSAFFGGLLFFAVSLFLAMLVVWVLFTLTGKHLSFMAICNVTAVAYIPVILATVFSFVCSFSIFTAVIGGLVSTVAGIATMILLYGAITRLSDRRGQMIWLYIAAQTVLKILIGIVAFVLIAAIIMGALMVSSYRYW